MIDLRAINREQFSTAKFYWGAALALKLVIFAIGAWAIFSNSPSSYLPQSLLVLAIASELCQLKSDGVKSRAESLLRTLDICRSFDRAISEADKRDIVLAVPKARRKTVEAGMSDHYFDTTEAPGPRGAVQNLIESAWYTRHLAAVMTGAYAGVITLLVAVAISALVWAARSIADPVLRDEVVRAVTAWMLLIVSLSMIKSVWAYIKMYQRCQRTELVCCHLLQGDVSEADALKQWYEYQIARASSPLLPDWLWKTRKSSLDEAWRLGRQ